MSVWDFKGMLEHVGHEFECVIYGSQADPNNVSLECVTCNVVIVDYDSNPQSENDE